MENSYLKKVIDGDTSKFSYFIENYKHMAFSIAFRVVNNREDAEEIVQDSFLKAFKSLKKFRQDSKFSTWFYKIVVNCSLSKIKKHKAGVCSIELIDDNNVGIENVESVYKSLTMDDQKKYINIALD
nr:sigma-70 family RNA polymerase sigma factor [Bacteroidota bacterium]